jgi:hypothetical protein
LVGWLWPQFGQEVKNKSPEKKETGKLKKRFRRKFCFQWRPLVAWFAGSLPGHFFAAS